MIARRTVLAGLAAGVALPASLRAAADLRATLDTAAANPTAALRALAAFDPQTLAPPARLDLVTARAGLAIDAALDARFPAGAPGRSPYRVTPRTVWRDVAAIDRDTMLLAADQAAGVVPSAPPLDRTIAALDRAMAQAPVPIAAALARQRTRLTAMRDIAPPPGLSHLRDGAALYTLYLRRASGSDIDAGAALTRLAAERDTLLTRADRLFATLGMRERGVGARFSALWRDSRFLYPDTDVGRAQAVAAMRRLTDAARVRIATQFDAAPAFALACDVRALSPAEIAAGRQGYREVPTPAQPGAYVVDLIDIRRRPAWTLPSVVAHELLPGHMLQLGIEGETPPHPLRLDYASAFVEGWGIYAETLAPYPDPRDELGHVHWLLFRVGRAIVDLNIHLHGWTPAQARAALVQWQGEPAYFAPFDSEIDRIVLEPGARVGEAMAWLAIADRMRGATGAARIARHRAILAFGRKRTETISTTIARTAP